MIKSSNVDEFVANGNLVDLEKILRSKFKNILLKYEPEEVINAFICKCIENDIIERFDEDRKVKFSTYMYQCFWNFILAYFCTPSQMNKALETATSIDYNPASEMSLHNILPDGKPELSLSVEKSVIYSFLKKEHSDLHRASVPLYLLYSYIVNGNTDKDISNITGLTIAGIGARKKVLVKKLKKYYQVQ